MSLIVRAVPQLLAAESQPLKPPQPAPEVSSRMSTVPMITEGEPLRRLSIVSIPESGPRPAALSNSWMRRASNAACEKEAEAILFQLEARMLSEKPVPVLPEGPLKRPSITSVPETGSIMSNSWMRRASNAACEKEAEAILYQLEARMLKEKEVQVVSEKEELCDILTSKNYIKQVRQSIWRNVGLLTLATHLNYAAYFGIGNLQIILKSDQLLYSVASKLTLGFYAFASYLFPTLLVSKLGLRKLVILAFFFFITYTLANYYPCWYTLLPTAILRGASGGVIWSIKGTCLATWGNQLSKITNESIEFTVPKFFGIFFGGYQASFITAIMISSFLIHKPASVDTLDNVILREECIQRYCYSDMQHFFQAAFNQTTMSNSTAIKYKPDEYHTFLLYGVFTVLGVLAIVVAVFITSDKTGDGTGNQPVTPCSLLFASVGHLFQPFDLLLLPSYLYIGVVDAFSGSELTMGVIPCISGVDNIGFVFTVFGASSAVFGVLAGYAVKFTGRPPVFMFGFIVHAIVILAQQYLPLDYSDSVTIGLVSVGWGIAAVIMDVLISVFIGCVYPEDSAPVIANFILFQILGNSLWRIFSAHMCLHVQLYVVLALLVASMTGYIIIETILRVKSNNYKLKNQEFRNIGNSQVYLIGVN